MQITSNREKCIDLGACAGISIKVSFAIAGASIKFQSNERT